MLTSNSALAAPGFGVIAPSHQTPGLTLERAFSFIAGGALKIEQRVVNSTDNPLPARVRLRTASPVNGHIAFRMPEGLIWEPANNSGEYPLGETDIVAAGAQLAENWMASEGEGLVFGVLWQGTPVQEMEWNRFPNLTYDLGEIPPHSSRAVPDYWIVATSGDWSVVHHWWKRLVQPTGVNEPFKLEPLRVMSLDGDPSPVLLVSDRSRVDLVLHNLRGNPASGRMSFAGSVFQADPAILPLDNVNRDNPLRAQVSLCGPDRPGAGYLDAEVDMGVLSESLKLPVVRLGAGDRLDLSQPEPAERH